MVIEAMHIQKKITYIVSKNKLKNKNPNYMFILFMKSFGKMTQHYRIYSKHPLY